jgi:hypothetical protein
VSPPAAEQGTRWTQLDATKSVETLRLASAADDEDRDEQSERAEHEANACEE